MKLLRMFVILIVLSSTAFAAEQKFVQGTHYMVMDMPVVENTVWEVFSVYCPYCEQYEKLFSQLEKDLPDVDIEQLYYARYGQYGDDAARVLAVMKSISDEKYNTVKAYYFNEIITNRGRQTNGIGGTKLAALGLKAGEISGEEYKKALESDGVKQILASWADKTNSIVANTGSIPAIIVKGKYIVKMSEAGSYENLKELINFLLNLEE